MTAKCRQAGFSHRILGAGLSLLVAFSARPVTAAPGDILFSDNFNDGTLAPWTSTDTSRSGVSNATGFANSGPFGAFTRHQAVTVTGPAFNAAVPEAQLQMWVRRGSDAFSEDTDGGEDFVLEYQRADNSWGPLQTFFGGGTNGEIINVSLILPPDALHNALAIRVRQTGGSGPDFDYWHFDDIVITEIAPSSTLGVGSCDEFENGLGTNWNINAVTGFAGVNTDTFQSPSNAMFLNGGVVDVTTNTIDTSGITFGDLTMWIRRGSDAFSEDPDGGEDLVVEYLDTANNWIALETFVGNGAAGQILPRTYDLPAAGRHAGFQLRFRMTGGSGAPWDYWHIDDVCFDLSTDPVLQVTKIARTLSDPVNGTSGAKSIPGAIVEYTIGVTNQGLGQVDSDSLAITDVVPPGTELFVDTAGGDPIVFVDGPTASGLPGLNYPVDVTFSNQVGGGAPYNYSPPPGTDFDPAITGFRIALGGTMNGASGGATPSFNIRFQVRVQ